MKILFLDHDGVICLAKQWGKRNTKKSKAKGEVFDPFTGTFRRTRINPFTGALEYLPVTPSAFSQAVAPNRRQGFGNLIVV